jgi:hypothetical protein
MVKYKLLKDKRGYSLSGWTETALFITLFIGLIGLLIVSLNVKFDENFDKTFGRPDRLSGLEQDLNDYQNTLQKSVTEGSASSTGLGISLTTTWNILSSGSTIMWSFLTGGFIEDMVSLAGFPMMVGRILRILFVLSIGFIILKLVLRIKP